ncbi:glycerol-3-phosphate 1-O-acyltransferase PlsY [Bacillus sp. BP-3]|uniref:glycerol-3-phosphate 1-O-acyltransferase PlsY n=1 Tax=Bacillus sp. BP-3 TaxID=3022773 RepID=UPI00232F76B7|nr:glycerol-3-phosphate 1-O-acyltransferase PlsY [Bacillus sp. BP-3]MDC2866308.1 glycerol-3-phosphate 1-O-acyltransferase PlsY [Bacillus sp. BP-3]
MVIYKLCYLLFAYMLGSILTAYFIIKFKYDVDIREQGSCNPGARNMGRLYGKSYFVITFIGDSVKGAIVVFTASFLSADSSYLILSLLAVVTGHLYPIWFQFKGGKGVSTFIGGFLVFNPLLVLPLVVIFLILYVLIRSFTKAGLITIACVPLCMFFFHYSTTAIGLSIFLILLILYAHRKR